LFEPDKRDDSTLVQLCNLEQFSLLHRRTAAWVVNGDIIQPSHQFRHIWTPSIPHVRRTPGIDRRWISVSTNNLAICLAADYRLHIKPSVIDARGQCSLNCELQFRG